MLRYFDPSGALLTKKRQITLANINGGKPSLPEKKCEYTNGDFFTYAQTCQP